MDTKCIDEQWLELQRETRNRRYIVAISNTGKYRRADGTVGCLMLRQHVRYQGKLEFAYRIIAKHFLITVRRPDQQYIDHIQHNPTEYNVNDIRNLRYCTEAENHRFEEAREHLSIANSGSKNPMYGRAFNKNPNWKGNKVGPHGAYIRALKLYKAGDISEEDFQPYRDRWQEDQKKRRSTRSRT